MARVGVCHGWAAACPYYLRTSLLLVCQTPGWLIVSLVVRFFAFAARAEEYKKWEPAQVAPATATVYNLGAATAAGDGREGG